MRPVDELLATALAHHRAGRLDDAATDYQAALALAPGHTGVLHNLGVIAAASGAHAVALARFDEVLAAQPDYAAAHYNRAVALQALGQLHEAIGAFGRVCTLEPEHYDAHRALGFLWLAAGNRGRSLDHFARTYELRRGDDRGGLAAGSLTHATRDKVLHDAAQFRYLSTRRRDGLRFERLARAYEHVAAELGEGTCALTLLQRDTLGGDYNTAIHLAGAPEVSGRAINPDVDAHGLTQRFEGRGGEPGAVWFDALLTAPALAALQRHLLESTIWHDFDHIGGFVASYLEDGLACPLILQIADEVRRAFPGLLGHLPLTQAWAFKALRPQAAVDAHADDGAVSLNFWVTPDAANLDPATGGLLICLAPPPEGWSMSGYDADAVETAAFLDAHAQETTRVPYGENRAALFKSRLFHRSDAPRFAAQYASYRINLTLVFGHYGG